MRTNYTIMHADSRRFIAQQVMQAPVGHIVTIGEPTRTLVQNSKMHACFGDIAKQTKYLGRVLVVPQWKTLLISGHAVATGLGVDMVPGIEGEFVNIRESSANMTVPRMCSVIEYSLAYGAQHNVNFGGDI